MAEAFPRGRFVWHELMTTNPDLAARFYPKVTGWKVQASPEDSTYRLWMVGKAQVGGLMTLPEDAKRMGAPPQWMPYIAVPDAADTVRQAQSQGARVYVPPQDIPWGRFATLADPQGASFSVFQPKEAGGTDTAGRGEFSWHELATTDWRTAWAFYQRLFGWEEVEAMDMGPAGMYFMFKRPGMKMAMGGMYTKPSDMPDPPHWLCYVSVADADTAARGVKAAGGTVVNGPMDVPGGGRIAMCIDPQGAGFAVHSQAAARAKPKRPAKAKAKAKKPTAKKAKKKVTRQKPARRARGRRR